MFCNYCRALNPNDAVYCSACGRTINPSLESGKVEHKAENLAALIPEIDASVVKAPDEASPSWEHAKMGDEELDQLREAYQKLNVPIPPTVQSEIERRGRDQASDSRSLGSLRSNSGPVPSSDLVQSPSFAHVSEKSPGALAKKEGTKVIEKFALLSVAALFFSGYLIFLYAPSKGFNFQYTPVSLIGFAIGLALVLLPSILAAYSNHTKFVWVMLVNIFFSWTIIFWIVALIWSLTGWKDRHAIARQGLSAPSELSASSRSRFRDVLRIDLGGRWYVRLLKVCIAVIGAYLLVLLIFILYGFVKGVLGAIH
jgi:hypothetical protein